MLIGLILTGGIVYTYIGSKRSYGFNEASARLQENGRFAAHFLTRDIRKAGYMGCGKDASKIKNTLRLTATDSRYWDFEYGVEGIDNRDSNWNSQAPAHYLSGKPKEKTDVITVRFAADKTDGLSENMANVSSKIHTNTDNYKSGDILLITDCKHSAIFQASDVDATTGVIKHSTSGSSDSNRKTPANRTDNLGMAFDDDSHVTTMHVTTYYIAPAKNAQVSSLWRKVDDKNAEELVRGVADMQILYGEDTNDDRMADDYVDADLVNDMTDVVSVRINLLLTSLQEIAKQPISFQFNGDTITTRYLLQEFTTTVNLRNHTP